ncbi:DUF1573 domain-containing protein [Bacteroidales bacterium OttesenSCG-928-K03]|nr:DUF1573 domain-containing protein [Odoribacter sp. OttesenSCG-928-L07]MDL2239283.1 DUF1573 domain-containing protein [Bacteroidales bacterium OttesenSCG-928-L14]MDL2240670.1 DUF1573 domain-containing protein [Bacteroidales bacterium OttesenSCG-928-K22]MDL2242811.1 DUF1573 domain-containing protein [Bacteroidales bacterium OttesenSCG-928-K03]
MKKLFIMMSMIVAFSTISFAQEKAKDVNPHAPYMEFDKVVHDYGKIMENGDGTCVFTLTNTGKEPLILNDAKSTCGCTVPEWTKAPILPGKSTEIKVKYATNRVGQINKSVTITSNASNSPIVLRIKGEVLRETVNQSISNPNPATVPTN